MPMHAALYFRDSAWHHATLTTVSYTRTDFSGAPFRLTKRVFKRVIGSFAALQLLTTSGCGRSIEINTHDFSFHALRDCRLRLPTYFPASVQHHYLPSLYSACSHHWLRLRPFATRSSTLLTCQAKTGYNAGRGFEGFSFPVS